MKNRRKQPTQQQARTFHLRALRAEDPNPDDTTSPITFIASTEGIKRDGMELKSENWELTNYRKNPVFLWAHDYVGNHPPIGRAEVKLEDKVLKATVTFDSDDPFAASIERKYRNGFLNAVSVGWNTILADGKSWDSPDLSVDDFRYDLLDISAVPVPGDPDALEDRRRSLIEELIDELDDDDQDPPTNRPQRRLDVSTPWEPATELARATDSQREEMMAHVSEEALYFPHHTSSGELNWRGVTSQMVRIFTDPPADLTEEELKAAYDHLVRHYAQFRQEPPEWLGLRIMHGLGPDELRGLFSAGEADLHPVSFERAGAVLSKRNKSDLETAASLIRNVIERSAKADTTDPEDTDDPEDEIDEDLARQFLDGLTS